LRAELQELKRCQLGYFLTAVAGGGAILALGDGFPLSEETKISVFFAPLAIVIPCWLTFFDKATTITRLVGYIRVGIEEQLSRPGNIVPQYIGYETALARFRKHEEENGRVAVYDRRERTSAGLRPPRHRYWMINWYTFAVLSLLSCALPIFFCWTEHRAVPTWLIVLDVFACIVFIASAVFTRRMYNDLTQGRYSYETVTIYWRQLLFSNREQNQGLEGSE
jgi:hypothetical protein